MSLLPSWVADLVGEAFGDIPKKSRIKTKTKAIKKNTTSPKHVEALSKISKNKRSDQLGINGDFLPEGIPKYINSACETILAGAHNTEIVFGRDRPSTRASGYGALGDTHAGSIDIVVGRMGAKATGFNHAGKSKGNPGPVECDVDLVADSARIYISMKTDIDANFNLTPGHVGTSKAKSGIGIKADAVRIIGREGIKLVTGTDAKNSRGSDIVSIVGVDIIAGNIQKEIQPLVKGDNLKEALQRMAYHVDAICGTVMTFCNIQMEYNEALRSHQHISPFFGEPTTSAPGIDTYSGPKTNKNLLQRVMRGLESHKKNLGAWENAYLQKTDKKYICSRWNNVN